MVEDINFRNKKIIVESKRNPTELFDPRPGSGLLTYINNFGFHTPWNKW